MIRSRPSLFSLFVLITAAFATEAAFGQLMGADFGLAPQTVATPGFTDVSGVNSETPLKARTFELQSSSGPLTAALSTTSVTGLEYRNRSPVTGLSVAGLAGDLIGTRGAGGGEMTLTLNGLEEGRYRFASFHNDSDPGSPGFSQESTFDVIIDEVTKAENVTASNTKTGTEVTSVVVQFEVKGDNPTRIVFRHVDFDPNKVQHMALSGFYVVKLKN